MKILLASLFLLTTACSTTTSYRRVAYKTLPSVVHVQVKIMQGKKLAGYVLGAGVLVSDTGHILTAAHLFSKGSEDIQVGPFMHQNSSYSAILLYQDKKKDLAVLKINYPSHYYAKLARPGSVRVGDRVLAIGHPLGLNFSVSHGIVSRFGYDRIFTQTDAATNLGNSGGPLFNMRGDVIGINSHLYTPSMFPVSSGLSMATSIESIHAVLNKLRGL